MAWKWLKKIFTRKKPIPYQEAKTLARHKDAGVRIKLAQQHGLAPEILYYLAEDSSAEVRRAVARNVAAPHQADLLLSQDGDDDVRTDLAEKITRLMPGLTADEIDTVRQATHEVLERLAHDQAIRVRRILSETLKDIAHAPLSVISRLARDVELVVCAPVLECSRVLTDEDLLNIINSAPVKGALSAIAKRRGISEKLADTIAKTDDTEAICELLANTSAQIREDTIDDLITRATGVNSWHAPLVKRPRLSRHAVLRLADFVGENLLQTLIKRPDITPDLAEAVREEFARRMEAAERTRTRDEGGPPGERAFILFKHGDLNDDAIHQAALSGDGEFVKTALSLKSKISSPVIARIFDLPSVKGVVAICWKAGLNVQTALAVQKRIARISPRNVLGSVDGKYPLSENEMLWQLEFFQDPD